MRLERSLSMTLFALRWSENAVYMAASYSRKGPYGVKSERCHAC